MATGTKKVTFPQTGAAAKVAATLAAQRIAGTDGLRWQNRDNVVRADRRNDGYNYSNCDWRS